MPRGKSGIAVYSVARDPQVVSLLKAVWDIPRSRRNRLAAGTMGGVCRSAQDLSITRSTGHSAKENRVLGCCEQLSLSAPKVVHQQRPRIAARPLLVNFRGASGVRITAHPECHNPVAGVD
jgi:hypothetical protein